MAPGSSLQEDRSLHSGVDDYFRNLKPPGREAREARLRSNEVQSRCTSERRLYGGGINVSVRQVAHAYVNSTSAVHPRQPLARSTEKPLKRCFSQEASEKS